MGLENIGHAYTYRCDAKGCTEETQVAFTGPMLPPFPPVPTQWVMLVDGVKDSFYGHIRYYCGRHDSINLLALDTPSRHEGEPQ